MFIPMLVILDLAFNFQHQVFEQKNRLQRIANERSLIKGPNWRAILTDSWPISRGWSREKYNKKYKFYTSKTVL